MAGAGGVGGARACGGEHGTQLLSHLSDGTRWDNRPLYARIEAEDPRRLLVTYPGVIADIRATTQGDPVQATGRHGLAAQGTGRIWAIVWRQRNRIGQDPTGQLGEWLSPHRCTLAASMERPRFDFRLYRSELYDCRWDPAFAEGN